MRKPTTNETILILAIIVPIPFMLLEGWGHPWPSQLQASTVIYYLTFIAIVWYTIETQTLRKLTARNFYGLLVLDSAPSRQRTNYAGLNDISDKKQVNFRIFFKNEGTGELYIKRTNPDGFEFRGNGSLNAGFVPRGIGLEGVRMAQKDTVEMDYILTFDATCSGAFDVRFSIFYSDANGSYRHRFAILNCFTGSPSLLTVIDEGKLMV